jgi:hypothetical protein
MVAFHDTTNDLSHDPPPQPNDLFSTEDLSSFQDTATTPCSALALAPLPTVPSSDDGPCSGPSRLGLLDVTEQSEEDELIRFYFNMFDYDSTGKIQLDEMKIMIRRIFVDLMNSSSPVGAPPFTSSPSVSVSPSSASFTKPSPSLSQHQHQRLSSPSTAAKAAAHDALTAVPSEADIEIMFENILQHSNINAKKTINFQEFKLFYNNLFTNSSKITRKR